PSKFDRHALAAITGLDLWEGLAPGDEVMTELTSHFRAHRQVSGQTYRKLKTILWPLVEDTGLLPQELGAPEVLRLLVARREVACELGRLLHRISVEARLSAPVADICHSLLHMHANRFLGLDRSEEDLMLGLMLRIHEARKARAAEQR